MLQASRVHTEGERGSIYGHLIDGGLDDGTRAPSCEFTVLLLFICVRFD